MGSHTKSGSTFCGASVCIMCSRRTMTQRQRGHDQGPKRTEGEKYSVRNDLFGFC